MSDTLNILLIEDKSNGYLEDGHVWEITQLDHLALASARKKGM